MMAFLYSSGARLPQWTRSNTSNIPRCSMDLNPTPSAYKTPERSTGRSSVPRVVSGEPSTTEIAESLVSQGSLRAEDVKLFGMLSDSRAALFTKVLSNRTRYITFVLDGVYGAHNLAAIVRSCDAWGLQDLHLIAQPKEYIPKQTKGTSERILGNESILKKLKHDASVQNVSKHCDKWLTIREHKAVQPCLDGLRTAGYKIIVSSLRSDAKPIHDVDLSGKCAFVFGNERHGVTAEMEAQADEFFTIPMMGFVESMNVSVAVGTTASLTTTRCRSQVRNLDYFLSPSEKSELSHSWLLERFSSKKTPKTVHTLRDVTKLGYKCERNIVRGGMFASVSDISLSGEVFWIKALRLTGDGGWRVADHFVRRKIGVLGENGHEKRCRAINFFLAGSHALSCEAALARFGTSPVTREVVVKYFELACDQVHEQYASHFDQFGVPTLPSNFDESRAIFSGLAGSAPLTARYACRQFASRVLGMNEDDVHHLVKSASLRDVARCIADTVRCGEMQAVELEEVAANGKRSFLYDEVISLLKERYPSREILTACEDNQKDAGIVLDQRQRDCLQVLLRLCNTAFLCSEVYQTVWDRHVKRNNVGRIHAIGFNLIESLLSDSYMEMKLLKFSHAEALFRIVFEWGQILERLKKCMDEP